jgi:tetratricopeptide (TPR) repeat protein
MSGMRFRGICSAGVLTGVHRRFLASSGQAPRATTAEGRRYVLWLFVIILLAATALAQQPPSDVQTEIKKGIEALERSDFRNAELHLSQALGTAPNLSEVRANLGLAYYADHKYSEAIKDFQRALDEAPSLAIPRTFLPLTLAAVNRCEEALPGLRREFPSNPDLKLRRVLGLSLQRCLLETGKQAEADQVTQQLLAQYADDLDVLYEAGQMYGKLSSEIYLRLLKVAPHSARGYQVMGQVADTEGNWQRAVDAYRQSIRMDPTIPGVHLALAIELLLHSPDPEAWKQALEELHAELKIDPSSAEAEYEIGEAYRKHDQPEKAIPAFRQALERRTNFVKARLELAKVLRQQNQNQEALAVLEPAREAAPDNAAVHFLLAQLYRDLGRTAEASAEDVAFKRLQPPPTP